MERELIEARECGVCREALLVYREHSRSEDRVVAIEEVTKKTHVCFDLPQDANLLVMEDQNE